MKRLEFFKQSMRNLKTVGTITRSSKFVCKEMINHVDFKNSKVLVELGAGDGVITKHILSAMGPNTKLLSFEVNHAFCEVMRKIEDDRLIVVEDSAEKLQYYIDELGAGQPDFIISAIPFVAMPEDLSYKIVRSCEKSLQPNGKYIQIHYSLLLKKMYKSVFGNVDVNFVPLNIPPAFVLVSEKRA